MEFDRITLIPSVMGGKPTIRGMRITVDTIVGLISSGISSEEILVSYPYLQEDDIRQALNYSSIFKNRLEISDEHISIEQYNLELDEALERINDGFYFTQQQVEEFFDKIDDSQDFD